MNQGEEQGQEGAAEQQISEPLSRVALESSSAPELVGSPPGGIVTARGTSEGLVIRLDGRVAASALKAALIEFLSSRRNFLGGQELSLEWMGSLPAEALLSEFKLLLDEEFGITVRGSSLFNNRRTLADDIECRAAPPRYPDVPAASEDSAGLFGGMRNLGLNSLDASSAGALAEDCGVDALRRGKAMGLTADAWDDPDARLVYGTLRSGQRVETEHSVVIVGDVNSGAEILAGGDIIVLGTLRGVAHAGAFDETGGNRFIFALDLRPTQLRIGSVISRGVSEGGRGSEMARIDGNVIVVETYQARTALSRIRA